MKGGAGARDRVKSSDRDLGDRMAEGWCWVTNRVAVGAERAIVRRDRAVGAARLSITMPRRGHPELWNRRVVVWWRAAMGTSVTLRVDRCPAARRSGRAARRRLLANRHRAISASPRGPGRPRAGTGPHGRGPGEQPSPQGGLRAWRGWLRSRREDLRDMKGFGGDQPLVVDPVKHEMVDEAGLAGPGRAPWRRPDRARSGRC